MLLKIFLIIIIRAFANSDSHEASGAHGAEHGEVTVAIEESADEEPGVIQVRETPEEIMIPSQIWDHLYTDEKTKPRVVFVPLKIQMKERNSGILSQEEVSIQLPRGGGEIDLSQFVKDKRGSFFVKFVFDKNTSADKSFVYFVSRNRKRKVDGVVLGSGCKSYFDVKKYVTKADKSGGILVNTTRLRHLSVLGGSFIFANVMGKEVRLAQVTFKDSKNSKYFCEAKPELKGTKPGESKSESTESL